MKKLFPIATIAAVILTTAPLAAAELPTFEMVGFPITPHQVAVLGPSHVEERSPTPTLTLGGMPASPHQLAVLMPRPRAVEQALVASPTN